jgi:hypothetical protein
MKSIDDNGTGRTRSQQQQTHHSRWRSEPSKPDTTCRSYFTGALNIQYRSPAIEPTTYSTLRRGKERGDFKGQTGGGATKD